MEKRYLSFYQNFNCKAGGCPDTCCAGWTVALSDEFIKNHREYDKLRVGKRFKNVNGRCPLLNDDGLCKYICANGQDGLNEVCKHHPRYFYDYGRVREVYFSLSCPEAAELTLNSGAARIITEPDDFQISMNDIDANVYSYAVSARNKILETIGSEKYPLNVKLSFLYLVSIRLSENVKNKNFTLPDFEKYLRIANGYDVLTDKNAERVYTVLKKRNYTRKSVLDGITKTIKSGKYVFTEFNGADNLLYAFVFNGLVKAAVYGDVLDEGKYIVSSMLYILTAVNATDGENAIKTVTEYIREIEHDDNNVNAIKKALKNFAF